MLYITSHIRGGMAILRTGTLAVQGVLVRHFLNLAPLRTLALKPLRLALHLALVPLCAVLKQRRVRVHEQLERVVHEPVYRPACTARCRRQL